jgi:hypothetical protein
MSTDELLAAALRLIHRFPYVIAFEKHEQHVLVFAVAHAKRRPLSKPSGRHNYAVAAQMPSGLQGRRQALRHRKLT